LQNRTSGLHENEARGRARQIVFSGTKALVTDAIALVPLTRALVYGTRAFVRGARALVPGTKALVPGTRAIVPLTNASVMGAFRDCPRDKRPRTRDEVACTRDNRARPA
jgi:hypothetical protein